MEQTYILKIDDKHVNENFLSIGIYRDDAAQARQYLTWYTYNAKTYTNTDELLADYSKLWDVGYKPQIVPMEGQIFRMADCYGRNDDTVHWVLQNVIDTVTHKPRKEFGYYGTIRTTGTSHPTVLLQNAVVYATFDEAILAAYELHQNPAVSYYFIPIPVRIVYETRKK